MGTVASALNLHQCLYDEMYKPAPDLTQIRELYRYIFKYYDVPKISLHQRNIDPMLVKVARLLYRTADTDRDGYVSYEDFTRLVRALASNDLDARIAFCFHIYDLNSDRMVQKREMVQHCQMSSELLAALNRMTRDESEEVPTKAFTCIRCKQEFDRLTIRYVCSLPKCVADNVVICTTCRIRASAFEIHSHTIDHEVEKVCPWTQLTAQEMIDVVFAEADLNKDDRLSPKEFRAYAREHQQVLLVMKCYVRTIAALATTDPKWKKPKESSTQQTPPQSPPA